MKQYFINLLLSWSRFFNAIILGDPNESLSQRVGRAYLVCPNWFITAIKWVIDHIFWIIFDENNHVLDSLEGETNGREIWRWCGGDE